MARMTIVEAWFAYNPRLDRFSFDYKKIAEQMGITEDQARTQFSHVELNPPAGEDLIIQLTVHSDRIHLDPLLVLRAECEPSF